MKKVLFVDASNLYHSIKQIGINPTKVDYHKLFSTIMREENPVVRFYTAPKRKEHGTTARAKQQSFFASLKTNVNLSLYFGKLQLIRNNSYISFREKGVDVKLAIDLIDIEYKIGVLLSGDTDLVPAVKSAREKGKQIINIYFKQSSGKQLRNESSSASRIDKKILMDCLREPIDYISNQWGDK
jgi:uncharacterized LabA/DUF88 family protein